ncbi:MAG TPA: head maturation protease, ClpP-related [Polyangiaceae bacterium]|jgi:ATP-dependent Clp endopeptidase proteolytic subunit ClpP|nr:head maturation protease, ClpP-related [Polyangiaceae bacterium]
MPKAQFAFALAESADGETLDLDIYSVIGPESFWADTVSAAQVRRQLKASKAKTINVRIMSDGGDVFDAVDIYDQLKAHPAQKSVRVGGLAASAASYVAMVGQEIVMGPSAWLMIHNPWGGAQGEADDLRSWAEVLDKMRDQFAAVYATRSGQSKDKMLELMDAETWLTAAEAVELGLVDRIDESVDVAADADAPKSKARAQNCFASASLRDFQNVPAAVLELATAAQDNTTSVPEGPKEQQHQPPLNLGEENETMAFPKNVVLALALNEDADEAAVLAAIKKLQASARVGGEIEKLVGATGDQAIGAVRALKETQSAHGELAADLGKVKASLARRDFESARDGGLKDKKLTPAVAKLYTERFEAAVASADGDPEAVVSDLQGFLKVAPRIATNGLPPMGGQGGDANALQWNGKTFAQLKPAEKGKLHAENRELYDAMSADWQAQGRPVAWTP